MTDDSKEIDDTTRRVMETPSFNWTSAPTSQLDEDSHIEQDIARQDTTPPIMEQASTAGFEAGFYHFGKAENDGAENFNPAIVERNDGYWMLTRRSEPHPQGFRFGQNAVWAFMLDETGKIPKMGKKLYWPVESPLQHFEDPRGFFHPGVNQTCVGACTFMWYPDRRWSGAHQCFGTFDENWQCKKMDYPRVGGNPGAMMNITDPKNYEKNWVWWLKDNQLHLLYKSNPWQVVQFGRTWTDHNQYYDGNKGVEWAWGLIRGGTSPVRVGDYYFTFHHSSLPWKGKYRRYYAGCIAFDVEPPFWPRMITREPLLMGSQNDTWQQRKPLVVFPCGAVFKERERRWLVTMGVNDMRAAWMEMSHEHLMSMMVTTEKSSETIFSVTGLSDGELEGGDDPCHLTQEKNPLEQQGGGNAAPNGSTPEEAAECQPEVDEYRPTKKRLTSKRKKAKRKSVKRATCLPVEK